jgi:uncharacterized FAD-dependent dehydrogenase
MSLLLSEIRLTPDQDEPDLKRIVAGLLKIPPDQIQSFRVVRRSVDARHDVRILYQIEIAVENEEELYGQVKKAGILRVERGAIAAVPLCIKKENVFCHKTGGGRFWAGGHLCCHGFCTGGRQTDCAGAGRRHEGPGS